MLSTQDSQNQYFSSYKAASEWVMGLVSFGIKPGLNRVTYMLEKLGNPERRLRTIHVAGTNGKGSTCAILTKILMECGYDVGTFTSPFLEKYTNRIQYNGNDIPEDEVVRLLNQIKPLADELSESEWGSPSMFEVTTVLAILYFATVSVPYYVVWETGLGGRLDSTNVVSPTICVITNVGHDHMNVLGDTLLDVMKEKAGIIKSGVPVVSAVKQEELASWLQQYCASKKSTLYLYGRDFKTFASDDGRFSFENHFRRLDDLALSLVGNHQRENAAVALMTIDVLRQYNALIVEENHLLYDALQNVSWPGRLEYVGENPRILVDGAHNPEGAVALKQAIEKHFPHRSLTMMIGMLDNKNHEAYIEHIIPIVDTFIVTEPDFRSPFSAHSLADLIRSINDRLGTDAEVVVEPNWKHALERLKEFDAPSHLLVVSGSLYLVSDVRSYILKGIDSDKGW